ncbi:MAG: 3-oxoacyl-[Desulfovibrionaceae bacterium]|nr:3-oxoacyl-[acyl-carrier-protein] reductase [Desulfovibrionaceae bacterium]
MTNTPLANALDPQSPTALVTGGSRGIGQAIAETLAQKGWQIILTYRSKEAEALAVVQNILTLGGKAACYELDIQDTQAIRDFFASKIKNQVNLTVLVNNAGITKDALLIRMKEADFTTVIDVCLRGTFVCTQEAAKIMTKNRKGRIINLASVVGLMGNPGQANYSAAKAGIIALTKTCAKELGSRQITCNALAPGFIETDMTKDLNEETKKLYLESIPLKRMGTPQDIAQACAFLASDEASYITGQVLSINGGMYC